MSTVAALSATCDCRDVGSPNSLTRRLINLFSSSIMGKNGELDRCSAKNSLNSLSIKLDGYLNSVCFLMQRIKSR